MLHNFVILICVTHTISVPIHQYQHEFTIGQTFQIFNNTFNQHVSDKLVTPTNLFTMLVSPKFTTKCMYATIENILTESDYHMPTDCGMPLTITVHDSTFQKSIVDIGTHACSQYNRHNCNPPMHQYKFVDDFKNKFFLSREVFRTELGGPVAFYLDTTLLDQLVVLKDEIANNYYWTTKYCSKYMTVTSDYKLFMLGPGIHYYDAANKQFCIADYTNVCNTMGPYTDVYQLYQSLPIYVTMYTTVQITDQLRHYDFIYSTPYDDHNSIVINKMGLFATVTGSLRKPQPNYQCVTYHTVPITSIFHVDVVLSAVEEKFLLYYNRFTHYIFDLIQTLLLKLFEKFMNCVNYFSFVSFDILVIFFYLMIYNRNYYTVFIVIFFHVLIKHILYM